MLRSFSLLCLTAICASTFAVAEAQTSRTETTSTCASDRLSIYYARGEAKPTPQALEVIAHISSEASRCNPDGIDIVTDIDTSAEGGDKQAIALALARLHSVAEALIANGIPADRIRMAASPDADVMHPPMGEVGVVLRRNVVKPDEASAPRGAAPRQLPDIT